MEFSTGFVYKILETTKLCQLQINRRCELCAVGKIFIMHRAMIISLVAVTLLAANTFGGKISCNRENEEYACGSACQTTCCNFDKPCPILNIKCNDACYCKEGYARYGGDDGPCVPISKCPKEEKPC